MIPAPEHPGQPQWRTYDEWIKTRESGIIELPHKEKDTAEILTMITDDDDGWGGAPTDLTKREWDDTAEDIVP